MMNVFPRLLIKVKSIVENLNKLIFMTSRYNIEMVGVTKVLCGDVRIVSELVKSGLKIIGDSRVKNVEKFKSAGINVEYMLIRIPMLSEIEKACLLCDYILVSEPKVVEEISKVCSETGKVQRLIYMVDMGDRREGVLFERAYEEILSVSKLKKVDIIGVGTNLGCFGGVVPDEENLGNLVKLAERLRRSGLNLKVVSGGMTSAIPLLENGRVPNGVNQYRIGEAIMLGTDATNSREMDYLNQDTFTLEAEIIEVKEKPPKPSGKIGRNVFGEVPKFENGRMRKRAILALGVQDVDIKGLIPLENGVEIVNATSDHTVVDITEAEREYKVGDILRFRLKYKALLRLMCSGDYIERVYLDS